MRKVDPISALADHYEAIAAQPVREDPIDAVFAARWRGQGQLASALVGLAMGLIPAALLLATAAQPSGNHDRAARAIARQQMLNSGLAELKVEGLGPAIR